MGASGRDGRAVHVGQPLWIIATIPMFGLGNALAKFVLRRHWAPRLRSFSLLWAPNDAVVARRIPKLALANWPLYGIFHAVGLTTRSVALDSF